MDATTLFYVGLILGLITGALGTLVFVKIKSLFFTTELRKNRQKKKVTDTRLQEKDRYVDKMLGHAEKLAQDFSKQRGTGRDH